MGRKCVVSYGCSRGRTQYHSQAVWERLKTTRRRVSLYMSVYHFPPLFLSLFKQENGPLVWSGPFSHGERRRVNFRKYTESIHILFIDISKNIKLFGGKRWYAIHAVRENPNTTAPDCGSRQKTPRKCRVFIDRSTFHFTSSLSLSFQTEKGPSYGTGLFPCAGASAQNAQMFQKNFNADGDDH